LAIFDLVFLAAFAASLITLIAAAVAAVRSHMPRAFSILHVWVICATLYLAANVRELGLVTGHGGPPCGWMSLFIIGNAGCLFHKQTMIRLPIE